MRFKIVKIQNYNENPKIISENLNSKQLPLIFAKNIPKMVFKYLLGSPC